MKTNMEKRVLKGERKFKLSLSEEQKEVKNRILQNKISILLGPPGTGKSLLSTQIALDGFSKKEYNRIIIARPAVEAGENLGFLPGDLKEKVQPYLEAVIDNLKQLEDPKIIDKMITEEDIKIEPIAFLRGKTLLNSIILIDEAQNCTPAQMFMILTRLGKGSKMIINGDLRQLDIRGESGLSKLLSLLQTVKISHINVETLTTQYRDDIVQEIINVW